MPLALAIGFYLTLDARAHIVIDVFPVLERTAQHGLAYTLQGGGDLLHQFAALFRVEDLPHEHAWLFKIVVVIAQCVSVAHHLAVTFPAVVYYAGLVGPLASMAVRRVNGRVAAVMVCHLAIELIDR